MNRGLSACPAGELVYRSPPPPPVFNGLHCLTLPAHPDLFVLLKKNVSGVLWDQESTSYHFLLILFWMRSLSYVAHLLEPCDCCSVLSDGWVSGPVAEHPPPAPPPLRLLALSMRMAPFPRHRSAGTAFTVNSVRMEIYRVGKGRRQRDEAGR